MQNTKNRKKRTSDLPASPSQQTTSEHKFPEIDASPEAKKSIPKGPRIGNLKDLLDSNEYESDNQFLQNGYRLGYKRCRDVAKSIFAWHNETLNIWTHLLGAIIFIILCVWILTGFDVVKQKYGEMSETFANFHAKWMATNLFTTVKNGEVNGLVPVINAEWLRMEDFKKNLV